MENTELKKHLVSVIDEAIAEIEELKKSKFQAQEIKLEGPGKGIDGKPADGSLGKEEDSEEDDDKDEKDEAEKADDCEKEEDSDVEKADEDEDEDEDDKKKKAAKKGDKKDEKEGNPFAKSLEAQEQLMKSYVDEKFSSLEQKIASVLDSVRTLADQPVGPKGVTVDKFAALEKSVAEVVIQPLNKAAVADRLFELKKSRTQHVDSADIIKVETGTQFDVQTVAKKYGLDK